MAIRFALALACAAALCGIALAQGGGWAAVEGIPPGSQVKLRLAPPKTVKGMLVSVSASGMDVQKSDGSIRHVPRPRVAKVYLVGKAHKLRGGLIGAGVGFAAGAVLEYRIQAKYTYSAYSGLPVPHGRAAGAAIGGLIVGAAGAVIGAVIGSHHSQTLVYSSESGRGKSARKSAGQNPSSRADAAHRSPAARKRADPR